MRAADGEGLVRKSLGGKVRGDVVYVSNVFAPSSQLRA